MNIHIKRWCGLTSSSSYSILQNIAFFEYNSSYATRVLSPGLHEIQQSKKARAAHEQPSAPGFLNIGVYAPLSNKAVPNLSSPQDCLFFFNFRRKVWACCCPNDCHTISTGEDIVHMDFVFWVGHKVVCPVLSTTRYIPWHVNECEVLSLELDKSFRISCIENLESALESALLESPQEQGLPFVFWTTKLVQYYIGQQYNISYNPRQVRNILHKMGMTCQKPRPRHLKASEKAQKEFKKKSQKESDPSLKMDSRSSFWTKASSQWNLTLRTDGLWEEANQ